MEIGDNALTKLWNIGQRDPPQSVSNKLVSLN